MTVYLDSSILVTNLYEEHDIPARVAQTRRLFSAVVAGRVQAMVSFYVLPEMYGYVTRNYPPERVDEVFRNSLVELFSIPIIVKPFVDRIDAERLRRRFTISDSADVSHVVAALFYGCSAIITFDHHFREISHLIPVFTPDEYLATLENASQSR